MMDDDGFIIVGKKNKRIKNDNIKATNIKPENIKKMLCKNMIQNGSCHYGKECMYAHSLEEQSVIPLRRRVYDILKNNEDLSQINLHDDVDIYNTFLELTRMCYGCKNNTCTGGYNCKNGACHEKYVICYDDLQYGNCSKKSCPKIHLTKRKLKPYQYSQNIISVITSSICMDMQDGNDDECLSMDTISEDLNHENDTDEIILTLKP